MIDLGKNIRQERQARSWSLKKLSSLIGVSIMTLQRIETGKVSPSVDLLTEIAYQLDLPVTEFVSDKEQKLIHLKVEDLPRRDHDSIAHECLFPAGLLAEEVSIWLTNLAPGAVIEGDADQNFEGCHVLDGQSEIEFDDRKVRLQAGETLFYDARFRQRIKSGSGARAIVVLKA